MARRLLIGLVAACALVGWGCGEEPETPLNVRPPAWTHEKETPPAEAKTVEAPKVELTEAPKVEVPKVAVPEAPEVDSPEVQALIGQAKPLLEQATQYIKDNKLELAKKAIDELMKLKTMLPPEWQEKIEAVVSAFNAQKALGGFKLPG